MCCDDPNMPKEHNQAKALAIACLVLGIIMLLLPFPPFLGWIAGLLSVIGASIISCCTAAQQGAACKHKACAILSIVAAVLNAVNFITMLALNAMFMNGSIAAIVILSAIWLSHLSLLSVSAPAPRIHM